MAFQQARRAWLACLPGSCISARSYRGGHSIDGLFLPGLDFSSAFPMPPTQRDSGTLVVVYFQHGRVPSVSLPGTGNSTSQDGRGLDGQDMGQEMALIKIPISRHCSFSTKTGTSAELLPTGQIIDVDAKGFHEPARGLKKPKHLLLPNQHCPQIYPHPSLPFTFNEARSQCQHRSVGGFADGADHS